MTKDSMLHARYHPHCSLQAQPASPPSATTEANKTERRHICAHFTTCYRLLYHNFLKNVGYICPDLFFKLTSQFSGVLLDAMNQLPLGGIPFE
jgi:hypothetical protein